MRSACAKAHTEAGTCAGLIARLPACQFKQAGSQAVHAAPALPQRPLAEAIGGVDGAELTGVIKAADRTVKRLNPVVSLQGAQQWMQQAGRCRRCDVEQRRPMVDAQAGVVARAAGGSPAPRASTAFKQHDRAIPAVLPQRSRQAAAGHPRADDGQVDRNQRLPWLIACRLAGRNTAHDSQEVH